MAIDINNPYFRTRVMTASPEELRLLLIEGCIRFMNEGKDAIDARNFEKVHDALTNARNILLELSGSLRHEIDPELCAKLDSIYNYVFRLTVEGSFEKDSSRLVEAIKLMEYDRETWVMLMEKLAKERAGGAPSPSAAGHSTPAPAGATSNSARTPISVSG